MFQIFAWIKKGKTKLNRPIKTAIAKENNRNRI